MPIVAPVAVAAANEDRQHCQPLSTAANLFIGHTVRRLNVQNVKLDGARPLNSVVVQQQRPRQQAQQPPPPTSRPPLMGIDDITNLFTYRPRCLDEKPARRDGARPLPIRRCNSCPRHHGHRR